MAETTDLGSFAKDNSVASVLSTVQARQDRKAGL